MATTPVYKWPTPDDTRAFRNGSTDMRALGNAIDATVKALDTAYKAADSSITSTATSRWSGHGALLQRVGQQATASTSNDVTLAMDTNVDVRGTANGGASLSLVEAGMYVITGMLEVGVGAGGDVLAYICTAGGTSLCKASSTRNGALRTMLNFAVVRNLGASVVLSLRYSTSAAMTITLGQMAAYRIGAS